MQKTRFLAIRVPRIFYKLQLFENFSKPVRFCLDSEKGQTRKKHSLAEMIETHPGIGLWKKQYAAQMQELFEMIFDCVEYACCYIETDRWKWLKSYFCEFNPEDMKESIPILLETEEINPLSLKNGKIITDKELKELQIAKEIQNSTKLDQIQNNTKLTEMNDVEEHEGTDYGGPPDNRTEFDYHTPGSNEPNNTEHYQNLTKTVRNNTYFDSMELETISNYPKTVILLIFVSFFIFIMRFRCHKSKNVLLNIFTRLNSNASSIIRNICSTVSAK